MSSQDFSKPKISQNASKLYGKSRGISSEKPNPYILSQKTNTIDQEETNASINRYNQSVENRRSQRSEQPKFKNNLQNEMPGSKNQYGISTKSFNKNESGKSLPK